MAFFTADVRMEENAIVLYRPAAEIIKTAILQGQYEAAKGVNRIQLAVYFGIGKFVSQNTRKGVWGSGALESISQILTKRTSWIKRIFCVKYEKYAEVL